MSTLAWVGVPALAHLLRGVTPPENEVLGTWHNTGNCSPARHHRHSQYPPLLHSPLLQGASCSLQPSSGRFCLALLTPPGPVESRPFWNILHVGLPSELHGALDTVDTTEPGQGQ